MSKRKCYVCDHAHNGKCKTQIKLSEFGKACYKTTEPFAECGCDESVAPPGYDPIVAAIRRASSTAKTRSSANR
jgi:hypothetical protein